MYDTGLENQPTALRLRTIEAFRVRIQKHLCAIRTNGDHNDANDLHYEYIGRLERSIAWLTQR